ncbi:MAG: ATP-binding protein [Bacteroidales bacterium]|nr:ATP-binding protein [Bacteroidales bacterium]
MRPTGIGLLLCREYLEKNSGTISVESREGKGTTFTVTLPLAKS